MMKLIDSTNSVVLGYSHGFDWLTGGGLDGVFRGELAARLLTAAVVGGIALAAVWLITAVWKSLSPRWQCWMWRLAYAKLLIAVAWCVPLTIPVLPPDESVEPAVEEASLVAVADVEADMANAASSSSRDAESDLRRASALALPTDGGNELLAAGTAFTTVDVLLVGWFLGVLGFAGLTFRQWRAARRIVLNSDPADSELNEICAIAAERLALRRPCVRVLRQVNSALLVGVLRPTLILPRRAGQDFRADEVRLMIGHELAHLKRRDLCWNWLPAIARCVFFFHPLVWLTSRRWTEAAESACDELMVRQADATASEFGRLLLKLSTIADPTPRTGLAVSGVLGTYRNLHKRILTMSHVSTSSRRQAFTAGIVLALTAVVVITPWKLVARAPAQQEAQQDEDAAITQGWEDLSEEQQIDITSGRLHLVMCAAVDYARDHEMRLPPHSVPSAGPVRLENRLSGMVLLLPYIGRRGELYTEEEWKAHLQALQLPANLAEQGQELFEKIDLTKGWDDPANAEAARTVFPLFVAPGGSTLRDDHGNAVSHFAFVRGWNGQDDGVFTDNGVYYTNILDGSSHTLAMGHVRNDLGPWIASGSATARYVYPHGLDVGRPTFGDKDYPNWLACLGDAFTVGVTPGDNREMRAVTGRSDGTVTNGSGALVSLERFKELAKQVADGVAQARPAPIQDEQIAKRLHIAGLGIHTFHDAYEMIPPGNGVNARGRDGRPLLSWRVHILPFIGEQDLYDEFNMNEPWDSEHNKPLLAKMPDVYVLSDDLEAGGTNMLAPSGEFTILGDSRNVKFPMILDGVSWTIMAFEGSAQHAVPWTRPDDFEFDPKADDALERFGRKDGDAFYCLMGDAAVRTIKKEIPVDILEALIGFADGRKIDPAKYD